ncbi:MAG TPA: iron ABC transporter permease [Gemmatimonadaceae bacterium]|nr:iron ABC transporter permease [Gemmatimonadaceae bacterium]
MRVGRWLSLFGALALVTLLGIALGTVRVPLLDVWRAAWGQGDPLTLTVVRTLRLPRVVLGLLVGAGLGMSGAALQGTMRNALAEPYLLGVSGGAAVGAVLALAAELPFALVPPAAFAGALLAVTLALVVARTGGRGGDPRLLLMAGVVVGAFANAVIMIALAGDAPNTVRNALWWMMGSVATATWRDVTWLSLYVGAGGALLVAWGRQVDVLALGADNAAALGLDAERATRRLYLLAALLAAATVAAAGLVGFVGLVVPHVARALGTQRHRATIVASALAGATLVVAADLAARTVRPPAELPLGAVTALVGVPFFLAQLRRLA